MANYRVDADALTALGFSLSAAADSGPAGSLAECAGCGSARVEAALSSSGVEFGVGWGHAVDAVVSLAVGAVRAADAYGESDDAVAEIASAAGDAS